MARHVLHNYRRDGTKNIAELLKADLQQFLPGVSIYLAKSNRPASHRSSSHAFQYGSTISQYSSAGVGCHYCRQSRGRNGGPTSKALLSDQHAGDLTPQEYRGARACRIHACNTTNDLRVLIFWRPERELEPTLTGA